MNHHAPVSVPHVAAARDAFRVAVEARDHESMVALLATDVILHSPIAFEPFRSQAVVGRLLGVLLDAVFEDFVYTDELTGSDGTHGLVFEANVGERRVQGLDLLRFGGDGRIVDFTVMVRPLSAATALRDAIAPFYAEIMTGS